jgi:hypothetical protein
MPQVPDLFPTAQPSGAAPNISLPVPAEAFGGAVGHALQGFGGDIEQASNSIWQRAMDMQGLKNETEAKEADAQYMIESGKLHADFINKEGLNAGPEALAAHIDELQNLRTRIRGSLSNPAAARMYDASSVAFMGRNIFNAAGHSGQQMKVAGNDAAESRITLAKTRMSDNPDDTVNIAQSVRTIQSEVLSQAQQNGWTDAKYQATLAKHLSEAFSSQVDGISRNDAPRAARLREEYTKQNLIIPQDLYRLNHDVDHRFNIQGSQFIAGKVLADRRSGLEQDQDIPEEVYVNKAREMAKEYGAADPQFPEYAARQTAIDFRRQRQIEIDRDNTNVNILSKAFNKANDEGLSPTSPAELFASAEDPKKAERAWIDLARDGRKVQSFYNRFEQNATGAFPEVSESNMKKTHILLDKAATGTPQERAEFMAHDWATEKDLSKSQRGRLLLAQEHMKVQAAKNVDLDPRVQHALGLLDEEMAKAGISKAKTPDDYHALRGNLQSLIMQQQGADAAKMKDADIIEMGKNLIKSQTIKGAGLFGMFDKTMPVYNIPVKDEDKAAVVREYKAKTGQTPTDTMVTNYIRQKHYEEFYGKKAQ